MAAATSPPTEIPHLSAADERALAALRKPARLRFDTARFEWRECVLAALGVDGGEDGGAALAALAPAAQSSGSRGGSRGTGTEWMRRWKARDPELCARTSALYVAFLDEILRPHVAAVCAAHGSGLHARGLLFQRDPSFRVHTPSSRATGRPHTDADYGHQAAELNCWLPVTACAGANSLYAESAPGAGDDAPFSADYGECVLFWGNRCRHYTVPNDTGRARVSLDFRFLPCALHVDVGAFRVGGYYDRLDENGRLDAATRKPRGHGVLHTPPEDVSLY